MRMPRWVRVRTLTVLALICAAAFTVGRLTSPGAPAPGPEHQSSSAAYLAGLSAGEAQGRQEGRALQAAASLAPSEAAQVRTAFNAGYVAGANDVFAGYDGGWDQNGAYAVTLAAGSGGITYRITGRTQMVPGAAYTLCAGGRTICRQHP